MWGLDKFHIKHMNWIWFAIYYTYVIKSYHTCLSGQSKSKDLPTSPISYVMWSSKISRKSEILILRYSQTKQKMSFVSHVFGILQQLISLEPIDQFQWGFLQNVAVKVVHTVHSKKENWIWPTSDWFCLITPHIYVQEGNSWQNANHFHFQCKVFC